MADVSPEPTPERIEQAAKGLRPDEREVLALSAGERLSCAEIGGRLGISSEKAERLLARALRKLDRALERQERPWWRFW